MTKILRNKSNIDLDYPICRPSLDLDFTQEELDSRITFSRGTVGTRVNRNRLIETVPANLPRFDYDPATGECKGLLIEESRSNLFLYSSSISTLNLFPVVTYDWPRNNADSYNTFSVTLPDGGTTGDKLYENTANAQHYVSHVYTTTNTTVTFSVYLKAAERSKASLSFSNNATGTATCTFDLKSGTVGTPSNGGDFTNTSGYIQPLSNGWYRCAITTTKGSYNSDAYTQINILNNDSSLTYTGDGSSGFYVWGTQLEVGAFPTSYIPTQGFTVTRSADNASMTGTNFSSWYNQSEGSIISNCNRPYAVPNNSYPCVLGISNGGGNQINIGYLTEGLFSLETYNNYLRIIGTYPGSSNLRTRISGVSYNQTTNTYSIFTNAKTSSTPTTNVDFGTDMNTLNIGNSISTNGPLVGTISRLTYYPKALKPNQLQLLTQ
jgi:hypothetical protein